MVKIWLNFCDGRVMTIGMFSGSVIWFARLQGPPHCRESPKQALPRVLEALPG